MKEKPVYEKSSLSTKLKSMGPALVIVGSFIGPGSITSSTKAGANYGFTLIWCVTFSIIAVVVLQGMASRLGIVTHKGICENLMDDFSDRPTLKWIVAIGVTVPIALGGLAYMGGDLTGTALGISALTGVPVRIVAAIWGVGVLIISMKNNALKWIENLLGLCVALMCVVFAVTMFVVKPDWGEVFKGAFVPSVPKGSLMTCISMIGTTVVPYNLFLHAKSSAETWDNPARDIPISEFGDRLTMILGGCVTAAVVVTSGAVMRGMQVENAIDMAQQLKPTLGGLAVPFMATGLVAAGISSAVCTPLGVSYVCAGLFGWKCDKSDKRFAATNIIVVVFGIFIALSGFSPTSILMTAQAVNGVFLPTSVLATIFLTNRRKIMGEYVNTPLQIVLGLFVFAVALIMGVSSVVSLF